MAIDRRRLARDAKAAEKARPVRSVGRPSTGALAVVEANIETIKALRADGVRWAAIAAALSEQGVHQIVDGERRPLSATRLTGFVRVIKKRAERAAVESDRRAARPGLVGVGSHDHTEAIQPSSPDLQGVAAPSTRPIALSPELEPGPNTLRAKVGPYASEEDLRRDALDTVRKLTKD